MHFVINVFVTAVCFISLILFKEILNKIVKVLLSVIGCGTLSYALAILVKKCGEWFGCWSGDAQYIKSDFLWIFAIVLVVYIIINIIYLSSHFFSFPSLEVITIFFRTTFKPYLSICRFYRLFLYF